MFSVSGCVAIITARGGSRRIPRKNIKDFLGKPIIAYSILAALEARCFDEVMVSTDDNEIAEIALKYGARVPFFRSAANSDDYATTASVLTEVLEEYHRLGNDFKYACGLYPTAPFITGEMLRMSHDLLIQTGADAVLPVVRFGYPVQRAFRIEDGRLEMIWPEYVNSRSQDLMEAYHDSGQFYWLRVSRFMETRRIFGEHTIPIVVPESEAQDIDTESDWRIAEIKYRIMHQLE